MAIVVYPLNNIDFTAEDVAIYNSTRTSGIYAGDDFGISLTGSDNTISIDVGLAWMHLSRFNGVAVALKSKAFVDMGLPNATYPRIDAIVLRFDANKNGAELVSKQGTASSDPKPPAVSRTEALYELHLLHVLRKPGATSITAADVTDIRLNAQYCGIMADAVTRVDTAAIDAQVTALIQKLRKDLQDVQDQTYYASKDDLTEVVDDLTEAVDQANEYAKEIASIANLLDNSDFTQFVAQAGIGGNHGNQAYAGDRWILDSGTVTGDAREDGNGYTNIKLNGTIRQIVANAPSVATVAIEMVSGTATATYDGEALTVTSAGGVIKNVALYEGEHTNDNLPAYQPKGYAVEMAECLRYFLSGTIDIVHNPPGGGIRAEIPLPQPLRISPTVTLNNQKIVYNNNAATFTVEFNWHFYRSNSILVAFKGSSTSAMTVGYSYISIIGYQLSADL